jgi:hypothetical protein
VAANEEEMSLVEKFAKITILAIKTMRVHDPKNSRGMIVPLKWNTENVQKQ